MEPSLVVDIALPTTAAGILVLAINTIFNRVIEIRKTRNGGTEPVKMVAVLEDIHEAVKAVIGLTKESVGLTRDNNTKLESLKKISADMESGIEQLQNYNTTSEKVSEARLRGHLEGREEARAERYKAQ